MVICTYYLHEHHGKNNHCYVRPKAFLELWVPQTYLSRMSVWRPGLVEETAIRICALPPLWLLSQTMGSSRLEVHVRDLRKGARGETWPTIPAEQVKGNLPFVIPLLSSATHRVKTPRR